MPSANESGHSFPHSLEAERAVLGSILLDNSFHSEAAEKLESQLKELEIPIEDYGVTKDIAA